MPTEAEIEAAATVAAERANGGRFIDPLFYKPEHRDFWRDVIRAALEAAEKVRANQNEASPKKPEVTPEMAHAGLVALEAWEGNCHAGMLVAEVYSAMARAAREAP